MTAIEVTAKIKDGKPVTVSYDFGDNLKEMVSKFGDEVVYSNAKANMRISLQDLVRAGIKGEKKPKEITKDVTEWIPGVKKKGKSKAEKLKDQVAELSPEEKKELLAKLTG